MTEDKAESGTRSNAGIKLALAWLAVGVPLLWGVVETLRKAMALFA
jgi:hypothetical protein